MLEKIIEKAKKENKKVYIYAHKFPDGDAISSSRAIESYLKNEGIDAKYVVKNDVKAFNQIVGDIPVTETVENDAISIIVDTSTIDYAENTLFKNSKAEDTYVIDHHGKTNGTTCIEDELGLLDENVIRNSNASSVCEILANELDDKKMTMQIANMITLGLITDTAKLRFLKEDTLKNLSKLISLGADYDKIIELCNRKSNLRDEVGLSKVLLNTKKFPIGETFGMILVLDNKEVQELGKNYRVRNPQKKIFKMADIDNCSFTCMLAENVPGEYNAEFRSTPICGNLNVFELATSHGGGGHFGASGCTIKKDKASKKEIEENLKGEVSGKYGEEAVNIEKTVLTSKDEELLQILNSTKNFSNNVTPEILEKVDTLIKEGVNYDYTLKKFRSFEKFMLQNEILSKIPASVYNEKNPNVTISFTKEEIEELAKKYNTNENDIISAIDVFTDVNINSALIILPNGKTSSIDQNGNIIIKDEPIKGNASKEIHK